MSKKVEVAGQVYDSRTIVEEVERLKLPNHPNVNALAIPVKQGERLTGKLTVVVKIKFGFLSNNIKDLHLIVESPRRIDAINAVVNAIKAIPMYRRVVPKYDKNLIENTSKNRL